MPGFRWALPLVLALVAPALAQSPLATQLVGQIQALLARIQPGLVRIPPGAQPPVPDIASRGTGLVNRAQIAISRAALAPNATIPELQSVLAALTAFEAELATVPGLVRDTSFIARLLVDAGRELDRARQALAAVPSARAETLFAQAQDALGQARLLAGTGQLSEARQFADRAIRLSRELQHLTADREQLRRRIEHALREIDRLADLAPPSAKAPLRLKLQEADRLARAAREAYLADSRNDALSQLDEAEKLVGQAQKMAEGKHGPTPFETRRRADERLKAAASTIYQVARSLGQNPGPLAVRTIQAARRYQQRAEDFFARGLYESAGANAHLAQRLANRAANVRR